MTGINAMVEIKVVRRWRFGVYAKGQRRPTVIPDLCRALHA